MPTRRAIAEGRAIDIATTKLLSLLFYPLGTSLLLVLFALVALRLEWRRSATAMLLAGVAWLYACATGWGADFLMGRLERDYPSRAMSVVPQAQVIVLLGGASRGHVHMGALADLNGQADRLVHAAALYQAGKAPLVLITGGAPPGDRAEAEQIKDILAVMGVPPRNMLLETASRDTHDNAVNCARLLRERGITQVLLVTSAFHMRRAEGVFAAQGVEVIPAPTDYQRLVGQDVVPPWLPQAGNLYRSTLALHEFGGFWAYRLRGWL